MTLTSDIMGVRQTTNLAISTYFQSDLPIVTAPKASHLRTLTEILQSLLHLPGTLSYWISV